MKKDIGILTILLIFTNLSLSFSQIPVDGLVGYWSFSGNANDESNNSNNGTVIGAKMTEDRFGNSNSAYFFDGENDKILISEQNGILTFNSDEQFSISFWIMIPEFPNYYDFIYDHKDGTLNGIMMMVTPEGRINVDFEANTNGVNYNISTEDALTPNKWYNLIALYDGINREARLYLNSRLNDTVHIGSDLDGPIGGIDVPVTFGYRSGMNEDTYFSGKIDDIAVYDRLLTSAEIKNISSENMCSDIIIKDTTVYYVSDNNYMSISPQVYLYSFDSLQADYGCDSILNHFIKYVFIANYCTDTLEVYDTIHISVYDTISVTDTLIIDAVLTTGFNPPDNINTIKVYPNPTKDFIFINTGDYTKMNGYQLKIINQTGTVVFETRVEEPLYKVNLSTLSGKGLYFIQVIDSGGSIIDIRKIILQ